MRDLIKKFFNKKPEDSSVPQNNNFPSSIPVATAAILLEMANIDNEFSDIEEKHIIEIVKRDFQLSVEDAEEIIEISSKELDESIDLWKFASMINENYSTEEKIKVMETVWRVIYADGKLDMHEDYLVHKLSKLLKLTHKQLIDAKMKVLYGE